MDANPNADVEPVVECHIHCGDKTWETHIALSDLLQLQEDVNVTATDAKWQYRRKEVLTDFGWFVVKEILTAIGFIVVVKWALF